MKIYVKYMVSSRCKEAARNELRKLGLHFIMVDLGEIEIRENLTGDQRLRLSEGLRSSGLELMDDKRALLVEKIIDVVAEMISSDDPPLTNYSTFLQARMKHEYKSMAALFMELKGMTLQHYIIVRKTERAKELLVCNHLSIADIAFKLHYSSSAHLSNQFKKVTGLTLLEYRHRIAAQVRSACQLKSCTTSPGFSNMRIV